VDAGRRLIDVTLAEESAHPDMIIDKTGFPEEAIERGQREMRMASRIVVNSSYCAAAIREQGVEGTKVSVLPIPYDGPIVAATPKRHGLPLRVLYLGAAAMSKGIVYLIDAARTLEREEVRFTCVGSVQVHVRHSWIPKNIEFRGTVARSSVRSILGQADVLVFPTLSDGFGLVQLEAMAAGLPVIATRNCGEVVEHMRSGVLVAERSAEAIAQAVMQLVRDKNLLSELSAGALKRVTEFRPERLWPAYARVFGDPGCA
jgi:glycosyltransferase involved in cell wall biosynthesis